MPTFAAPVRLRPLARQSDARLVELAAAGREDAFEVLVRRHRHELHVYASRVLGAETRAEDVVQHALVSAWLALQDRRVEVANPRAWLYGIVHNRAVTLLRRAHHPTVALNEAVEVPAVGPGLEPPVVLHEIFAGLADMPEPQRRALLLTAVGGASHDEAAASLGLTGGAVRGLVYRARRTLREATAALLPPGLCNWLSGLDGTVVKTGAVVATAGVLAGAGPALLPSSSHRSTRRAPSHVTHHAGLARGRPAPGSLSAIRQATVPSLASTRHAATRSTGPNVASTGQSRRSAASTRVQTIPVAQHERPRASSSPPSTPPVTTTSPVSTTTPVSRTTPAAPVTVVAQPTATTNGDGDGSDGGPGPSPSSGPGPSGEPSGTSGDDATRTTGGGDGDGGSSSGHDASGSDHGGRGGHETVDRDADAAGAATGLPTPPPAPS